jgi:hypothetical protein
MKSRPGLSSSEGFSIARLYEPMFEMASAGWAAEAFKRPFRVAVARPRRGHKSPAGPARRLLLLAVNRL